MNSPDFQSPSVDHYSAKRETLFIDDPDKQSVRVCTEILLKEYLSQVDVSQEEIELLIGYKEGRETWGAQHLLSLNDLGIETAWIENVDLDRFSLAPFEYMRTLFPDDAAYRFQIEHADLPLEARRIQTYLDRGLLFKEREPATDDIRQYLLDGWVVRLEIGGNPLTDRTGYAAACSAFIVELSDETVVLQNLDNGLTRSIDWELLEKAWQEFGDSKSLNAYRLNE